MRNKGSIRILKVIITFILVVSVLGQESIISRAEQNVTRYSDSNVYISPLSNQSDVSKLLACYDKIPTYVKNAMKYLGINIYIIPIEWQSGEDLDAYSSTPLSIVGAYSTSGSIERNSRGEVIKVVSPGKVICYTDMDELFYPEQLIHEVGHELEYMTVMLEKKYTGFGWFPLSMSAGMNELYTSEETIAALNSIDYLTSVNILRGCTEGFAELFRLYCTKPQELKKASQKSYDFIDGVMKDFDELQKSATLTKAAASSPSTTTPAAQTSSIGYTRLRQKADKDDKIITEYPFKHANWIKLTKAQKLDAVEDLVTYLCDDLEVETIPRVEFYSDTGEDCGYYLWSKNIVYINTKYVLRGATKKINGSYLEEKIVDTLAHEVRHRYQEEHMYDDSVYGDNVREGLRTYTASQSDLEAFKEQFLEKDSATYASSISNSCHTIHILVTEKLVTTKQ